MNIIKILKNNKEIKNAGWIIAGKVAQMLLSFFVALWTARYLGPSNYGTINYVAAYVAFFTSFCTLGITSAILVSEFTEHPEDEGTILGTSIVLRLISSFLSAVAVVCIVYVVDNDEPTTIIIAIFSSLALLFQVLNSFEYWFQKRLMSKVTSIAVFVAYCITSVYKIILLITKQPVEMFALASSIDYIVIAVFLYLSYVKYKGPKLHFSWSVGKRILSKSYNFILSGMMVAIYGQTDKLMLKHMLSETDVGYYSTASNLCVIWVFVLSAIIDSMSPTIMELKKSGNEKEYIRKNEQLYSIIFYLSIFVSLLFTIFSSLIINILYGEAYTGSIKPLRIVCWYVAFSYLGCARDIWLVCEGKQKYSKYIYLIAAFANVFLNLFLIPILGASGAALASLITQILTSMILPLVWKDMRPNAIMMFESIFLKNVFGSDK